eukprot:m.45644 g.45644  ORF g.45644 m.45644 type:complete len:303 (-) comp6677_c0_seq1:312-1220(-)
MWEGGDRGRGRGRGREGALLRGSCEGSITRAWLAAHQKMLRPLPKPRMAFMRSHWWFFQPPLVLSRSASGTPFWVNLSLHLSSVSVISRTTVEKCPAGQCLKRHACWINLPGSTFSKTPCTLPPNIENSPPTLGSILHSDCVYACTFSCVQMALNKSIAEHLNSSVRVKSRYFVAGAAAFGTVLCVDAAVGVAALTGTGTPALPPFTVGGCPFLDGLTRSVAYSSLSILSHLANCVRTRSPPFFRIRSFTLRRSGVSSEVNLTLNSKSSMSCSSLRLGTSAVPLTIVPSSVSPVHLTLMTTS